MLNNEIMSQPSTGGVKSCLVKAVGRHQVVNEVNYNHDSLGIEGKTSKHKSIFTTK